MDRGQVVTGAKRGCERLQPRYPSIESLAGVKAMQPGDTFRFLRGSSASSQRMYITSQAHGIDRDANSRPPINDAIPF